MERPTPPWQADRFARRLPALRARARIKDAIRGFFREQGFDEVEVPALQVSPGNETHIAAFATRFEPPGAKPRPLYLHTSPEFGCKKLLAAGLERIVAFGPAWRNGERGRLHHPEFTMVEWYRVGATLDELVADCEALLRVAADAVGPDAVLRHRDRQADPRLPSARIAVVDAFRVHAGLDLEAMLPRGHGTDPGDDGATDHERMVEATRALGVRIAVDDTWSDLFSKVLSERVEPRLGLDRATVLDRYPASEAALARLCSEDGRFADRFELYACGVELANAFAELRDPAEQRSRFEAAEVERERIYGTRHPIDEDLLAALERMPDCCGIALGFDRLVMLLTGAENIDDVLWLPVDGAEP